jgi:hypothetical protein
MPPNIGDTVYDIRAGDENWAAVGGEITRENRMGFIGSNQPKERLSVQLHVKKANPEDIPQDGLSLYEGGTPVGEEGAWRVVSCTVAGKLRIVDLST